MGRSPVWMVVMSFMIGCAGGEAELIVQQAKVKAAGLDPRIAVSALPPGTLVYVSRCIYHTEEVHQNLHLH